MSNDSTEIVKRTGIARIMYAYKHSWNGLKHAMKNEPAFKQEVFLVIVLTVILFFLPVTTEMKMILFLSNMLVLIVELINSSIEAIIDRISTDYHDLAKIAKDMGSSAVFLSLLTMTVLWLYMIIQLIIYYY